MNVTLCPTLAKGGEDSYMLIHADGWKNPFFGYYADWLIYPKKNAANSRDNYCRFAAAFIDYLIEAAKWLAETGIEYLDGTTLIDVITAYPKVLAGGEESSDPMVAELSRRLKRKAVARNSQNVHIAAVNHLLALSESFNIRMLQRGGTEYKGLPLFSESQLFPHLGGFVEIPYFERIALTNKSMIGGVVAGGARLKVAAALSPEVVDEDDDSMYDYDSAFPLEEAPKLIKKGFKSFRDKALYLLVMACGCRIHEALLITFADIDFTNRTVSLRNPKTKKLDLFYGYFTLEERNKLPWKGRTHADTLLLEPFATEFWLMLEEYMNKEMLRTCQHPFIFQILKGPRRGHPLILQDQSNLRKAFKMACKKIGMDLVYGVHSLRHLFGVYCLNYWPNEDGTFGLLPEFVQYLMAHSSLESTKLYAKPDTIILEAQQRMNSAILSGFSVVMRADVHIEILKKMLERAVAGSGKAKVLAHVS